ncbi:MAG TPA: flagellar hook assembly protein FlgD [Caulobacter sp.]|nr:flagellar hook assembly protein FlgD [Caulobacter sp.]
MTTTSATSPINTTQTQQSAAAQAAANADPGRTSLAQNFDMFLTLLTTQMKNQDPTSPMDSTQFMSQLVQMTGVEQQLAGNDLLKQLVANTGSNVSNAVDLIGKQVRATSADATLSNGQAKWSYSLDAAAADVKIEVLDSNGVPVQTVAGSADDMKAGEHSFTWDGKDMLGNTMPNGTYTLRVTATDGGGSKINSTTYVEGPVTAIELQNGQSVITINGGKVPVSSVIGVSLVDSNTNTTAGQTPAAAA